MNNKCGSQLFIICSGSIQSLKKKLKSKHIVLALKRLQTYLK